MSLLNPAILTGFALAAIPVLLHLLMRQRPKKLLFPALRLIQVRRKNNVRRLRLRHVWLLLLRVAVISLLVAAIARPSLPAANYRPNLREALTLAILFLVAGGAYWGMLRHWRRARMAQHDLAYRKSILRGGIGTALAVLFLLLVAWPYQRRISAEISSPVPAGDHNLPVAGVFLFDTSMSMSYRLNNKTRLELAQQIAGEHIEALPSGSRVGVADTSTSNPILFQADPAGAKSRLESLKPKAVSLSLNDRLRAALALQEEDYRRTFETQAAVPEELRSDRFLREIYIFTDFAASGWRVPDSGVLKSELEQLPWVQVYLIDVGVEKPINMGISGFRLSSQTVSAGGELVVDVSLESVGVEASEPTIELHVQNEKGMLVKREQRSERLEGATQRGLQFVVPGIANPITHGEIRLVTSDPFPADDIRYFTVAAAKPPEILIVQESRDESYLWTQALAPSELVRLGKARYQCTEVSPAQFTKTDLAPFDVVCLVNVRSLPDTAWNMLASFVQSGGGLAVILGRAEIDPVSYNGGVPQTFLPAKLAGHIYLPEETRLNLQDFTHPIFTKFEFFPGGFGDLATVGIQRCWRVDPNQGAAVITGYNDERNSPAFLERVHGRGRTLMLTTAVDLSGWSELPLARHWFVALADQIIQHLGRRADDVYNYSTGDEVILHLDPERPLRRYLLRKPGFEQIPGDVPAGSSLLAIRDADQIGQFEVLAAENDVPFSSGFSVNGRSEESNFDRIQSPELDNLLGKDRYSTAQNIDGLTRNVGERRLGKEMYGFVVLILMMAFCAEHFVANRFYEADEARTPELSSSRGN